MSLPTPPAAYSKDDQARTREMLRQMDAKNHKKGSDVELARNERLIMTDEVTGDRYHIALQSGVLVPVAL